MSFFSKLIVGDDNEADGEKPSFFSSLTAMVKDPHGALDDFLADLKLKLATETEKGVYVQCHQIGMAETLRSLIETGIEHAPIDPPKVLGNAAVVLLQKYGKKNSNERGLKVFFHEIIDRNEIDKSVYRSAMEAVERYMLEHRDFLADVSMESLEQKLRGSVTGTLKEVPYVKPPIVLSETRYHDLVPLNSGERGLFTSVVQGITSSFGSDVSISDSVANALMNDEALQAKIDKYAVEIRDKISNHTSELVYEQSHERQLADKTLRTVIERGIDKAPIHPPAAVAGFLADALDSINDDDRAESNDSSAKTTLAKKPNFFRTKLENLHLDRELKTACTNGIMRFIMEHKAFLRAIGIEAVILKLSEEPVMTKALYVKPPMLTVAEFKQNRGAPTHALDDYMVADKSHPDRVSTATLPSPQKTNSVETSEHSAPALEKDGRQFFF